MLKGICVDCVHTTSGECAILGESSAMVQTCRRYEPRKGPAYYTSKSVNFWEVARSLPLLPGSALKYIWRAGEKTADPRHDYRKALDYISLMLRTGVGLDTSDKRELSRIPFDDFCAERRALLRLLQAGDLERLEASLRILVKGFERSWEA